MEHESHDDTNCNWSARNTYQSIGAVTRRLGNMRASGDHLNFSIVEIIQNTGKNPGSFWRHTAT